MAEEISARRDGSNIIYSTGPDVCWTPMGSARYPVAYNSIAFLSDTVRHSQSVRNNHNHDFHLNSRAETSTGHEPGTGRGVKEKGYLGMALVQVGSASQYTHGWSTVRDGDPAWINRPGPGKDEKAAPFEMTEIRVS